MQPLGLLALGLAKMGLRIFPLRVGSKLPAIEGWELKATTDAQVIVTWWSQKSNYNIGIATGRADGDREGRELIGDDYDAKNGKAGLETFRAHELLGLTNTMLVRTPTGGIHALYWRRAINGSGAMIANSVEKIGAGVDVRGWHGYLVGPGSVIDGRKYEVIRSVAIAIYPEMLEDRAPKVGSGDVGGEPIGELDRDAAIERVRRYLAEEAPVAVQGAGGDNTTYSVAARCKDLGISETMTVELMAVEGGWNERCQPPWDVGELEIKVRNAFRYGKSAPGSANAWEEFETDPGWKRESFKEWRARTRRWQRRLEFSGWDEAEIPEREWAVMDRVPLRQVGLSTGEGGTGKSIIELMRNVAHVSGTDWLGMPVRQGPALYFGCEDDERELQIRLMLIARHLGLKFEALERDGLHVWPMTDADPVLAAVGKSGRVVATELYDELLEFCGDVKPINVSLDTLSHVFAGNELVRVEVYQFAVLMRRLARASGGSVTVLAHPSLAGMASGSGISGSTAWHGAFRFRMYLHGPGKKEEDEEQPDSDRRELEFKKNQYGPLGSTIGLRYVGGLFLPVVGASDEEREEALGVAENVFLALLGRFCEQNRRVHPHRTSVYYAPRVFAEEMEAMKHGVRMKGLEAAMKRLFDAGKIRVEVKGKGSHEQLKLVVA